MIFGLSGRIRQRTPFIYVNTWQASGSDVIVCNCYIILFFKVAVYVDLTYKYMDLEQISAKFLTLQEELHMEGGSGFILRRCQQIGYKASNDMRAERYIGKDLEGSGCGVIELRLLSRNLPEGTEENY
jgi:hypothetical protein